MDLICISLMISDVKHHFTCLLAISISSGEMSVQVLCPFFNLIVFLSLSCMILIAFFFNLEIFFVSYKYGYTHFSLGAICFGYCLPPLHFESVFVVAEMGFLKAPCSWVLIF